VPEPRELAYLLLGEPRSLAAEFIDYLMWRGMALDPETRRIISRFVELSAQVRTLSGAARGVYLSRRALGRRFRDRGLPVPSHWLQLCRILRATMKLQSSPRSSLHEVARSLGYPDGFTLSNQMNRLVGFRPSTARERLGWEWVVEAWLDRERSTGALTARLPGLQSMEL
jgi:transcriptional regulator GlxA family with amidase domain